jgi:hypothetical protein
MTPEEAFSGKKPNVEHLRIFGFHVYIHIPKDKSKKLEPSGKKGILVGYNESSKAYKIYILKQHKVECNRDVTFNDKMTFKKSIEEEEYEDLKEENIHLPESQNEEPKQLDHLMQPCEPIDPVTVPKIRKRPAWLEATLQEVERLKAPSCTFRERKKLKRFSNYATCMKKLINEETTRFE